MTDPQPHLFNVAFEVFRNVMPGTIKAVNMYLRKVDGRFELTYAFHTDHAEARTALDAGNGVYVCGVMYARGLFEMIHAQAWVVVDAFDNDKTGKC